MGWCSAPTDLFDWVSGFALSTDKPDDEKYTLLVKVAGVLEGEDWDCQRDSNDWEDPIVQRVFRYLHPDWFEDDAE